MITADMIPDEAMSAFYASLAHDESDRKAIAAALNAWPGKDIVGYGPPFYGIELILPLPQKKEERS